MSRTLLVTLSVSLLAAARVPTAHADDSAHCRYVRAQAAADAAVLRWPRLFVEGIRFPSSNRLDLGPTVGSNLQGRVGFAFSPLDWFRGGLLRDVGDADCAIDEAVSRAEDLLPAIDDGVRAGALRGQASYLAAHRAEWQDLAARASRRFEARLITRVELHQVREIADALELKLVRAQNEARRLEVGEVSVVVPGSLGKLAQTYVSRVAALDGTLAKLHALDTWGFKVSGGVIPLPGQPVDWFGIAEVSYSLGGPVQSMAQTRATAAHAEAIRQGRRELPARLERARQDVVARITAAREELAIVEQQLAASNEAVRALEAADVAGVDQARDTLMVERLSAESERVFLRGLLERLVPLAGGENGS